MQRGVHLVFHSSLLRMHIANDDRRFPGRLETQLQESLAAEGQWKIDRIVSHSGTKKNAIFEVQWSTGDKTWMSFDDIQDLPCLPEYLDLLGISSVQQLPKGSGKVPEESQITLGLALLSLTTRYYRYEGAPNDTATGPASKYKSSSSSLSNRRYNSHIAPINPCTLPSLNNSFFSPSLESTMSRSDSSDRSHEHESRDAPEWKYFQCISESTFQLRLIEGELVEISAQQFGVYLDHSVDIKKHRYKAGDSPIGYTDFAEAFNAEEYDRKLAYFDPNYEGEGRVSILDFDTKSPSKDLFDLMPYQCYAPGVLTRPGYVEIPQKEYKELRMSAIAYTKTSLKGRMKAEEKKERKKLAEAAQRQKKKGGLPYIRK
ncbi:hypothetical protein F5876DRAFT_80102 [Lentinula aff. lateritia]|uniref:Uncharacterized protein n=1 Tax=Lentinula aff. lateritia TaxID=2804960 RepID=A0ACC1TQM2_9AGAR|nr:hypothetical protein F5876DRAFT_80102 [Lentinula aff. lateritia]